ncbi:MAG TPA: FkbM family methyltransferase [Polyangiaceae bacterium]
MPAIFRLRTGERLFLRGEPAADVATAFEIFVAEVYRHVGPEPDPSVTRIVDVGANVGMSLVYWASRYPNARLVAFEPHPVHVASLKRNLEENGISDRVELHAAAACAHAGTVQLTDDEVCSSVTTKSTARTRSIEAVDFFAAIGSEPIDLMKMDIEGGEYELLGDPRFSALRIPRLVLEWHNTSEHPDGRKWCEERLSSLGYTVVPGKWSSEEVGQLWGFRGVARSPAKAAT